MHWLLAIVGAFLGTALGEADEALLGLVAGALVGWLLGRQAELRRRMADLEREFADRRGPAQATAPRPAPQPAQQAALAATAGPGARDAAGPPQQPTPAPAAMPAAASAPPSAVHAAPRPPQPPPPPRPAPSPAPTPSGPDLGDRIGALLRSWFLEGNVPVKIGMLVLFVGVAAALKYASDQGWFTLPIEFRLTGIALAALAGLVWGWRNRQTRPAFGLALQGGAIGVLLLTVFAAFRLYGLLAPELALGLVVVLVAAAAALAVLQDAVWLAALGFIAGYLAPVLISTGSGNHVALFGWYAVLNTAVFAIAWLRPWRALNLIGFAATFLVGAAWGAQYYRPEHLATVEPFLILFFLFYVAIPVLYARRGPRRLVDGTLLFGTPLLAFPLQAALLADAEPMALAYSALAVAALYAVLAAIALRRRSDLLGQGHAALAVGFATLAVPLALSPHWTAAAWAVEGAALVWLGLRQRQVLPQLAGWALQLLAAVAYAVALLDGAWLGVDGEWPVLNGHALTTLLLSLSALFLAWCCERQPPWALQRLLVWAAFLGGLFWWTVAGVRELDQHFRDLPDVVDALALMTLTLLLAATARGLLPWPRLGWAVLPVALLGVPLALLAHDVADAHALAWPGVLAWGLYLSALAYALQRLREPPARALSLMHVAALWTLVLVLAVALHRAAMTGWALASGWRHALLVLPLLAAVLATWRRPHWAAWPLADRFDRYAALWFVPAAFALVGLWLFGLFEPGNADPLPYLPVLNPVDLVQLAVLGLAFAGLAAQAGAQQANLRALLTFAALAWLTAATLRTVHHWAPVPWSLQLFDHAATQAALTVVWSIAGVTAWVLGSRRQRWSTWLAGAVLMGLVLVKLVLVDRQYVGNLGGIVSFLAVGALLVLVGRIAPTPPRSVEADA
ncbi:MAG TPA: DUF2339 domain-containing protein [Xanthomonadaceae bacterium]|nr:DUF2339 domain-containing protein [Xanthomonadaceae bacterium]